MSLILILTLIAAIIPIIVLIIMIPIIIKSIKLLKIRLKRADQIIEEDKQQAKAKKQQKKNDKIFESQTGEWSPTGWYYNNKTGKWEPPDHVVKESAETWQWDATRQIWINVKQERRRERYREYHKNQPPTFEEWKAQRDAEKDKPPS